jgi:hypothetical protein
VKGHSLARYSSLLLELKAAKSANYTADSLTPLGWRRAAAEFAELDWPSHRAAGQDFVPAEGGPQ